MSLSQSFSQKIGNVRPLNPCPSLDIDFANGGYVNTGGFANQESVGSANFKIGAFNGPDPIFTRATAATFRGSNGLIQYAPENLLLRSEEFNDAQWTKTGLLAFGSGSIANAIASPNGTITADFICEQSVSSEHSVYQPYSGFVSSGALISAGCFIGKSLNTNSRRYCFLSLVIGGSSGAQNRYVLNIDLLSGLVTEIRKGASVTNESYQITDYGNFWRITLTASSSSSGSFNYFVIGASNSSTPVYDSFNNVTYQGNGTSGIYIWGAQLERSSTARPYISTTTTPRYGPRFEYDLNGNPLGLLMEEQSENKLSYSEQFDNGYWTKFNSYIGGSIASPSGTMTADKLITNNAQSDGQVYRGVDGSYAGASISCSCFIKKGEISTSSIRLRAGSASGGGTSLGAAEYSINLNTGVATLISDTLSGTIVTTSDFGNGWYRIVVTSTMPASTLNVRLQVNSSGVGDGTSGIYIWGAQLEQKPFATSYIPTVAGAVTRSADVVNSTIGSWYNADEGTIVVKGDRTGFNIQDSLFEFTSGTTASLAHRGDGTDENFLVEDATTTVTIVETIPLNSPLYFAASYSDPATQVNATVNAEPVQGTTLASTITTPTTLNIGYSPEISTYFNGHIKAFRYYAKALPSRLESFTLTA